MNLNTRRRLRLVRKDCRTGSRKEVSASTRKNISMFVFHNVDEHGTKSSITRFVAINTARPQYKRNFSSRKGQ